MIDIVCADYLNGLAVFVPCYAHGSSLSLLLRPYVSY